VKCGGLDAIVLRSNCICGKSATMNIDIEVYAIFLRIKWRSLWFWHVFCVRKCRVRRSMVMYDRNDVWYYALIITIDKSATMNGNIGILATFPIVTYLMESSISRCISHSKMPNLEIWYVLCKRCQSNRYWVRLQHKCRDSPNVDEWPQQRSDTEGRCLKRMRRCVLSKKTTSNIHTNI